MDYKKLYNSIIRSAKDKEITRENLKAQGNYFERHHIIPESSGGTNINENLALLTAREHYICHWLLYKINPTNENAFSWWMMSNNNGNKYHEERKRQSSRKYEYARKAFSKHITKVNKGRIHTPQARKNMADAAKEKRSGKNNWMYGRKHSEEHKAYLSEINTGENNHFYGEIHTSEAREKMSVAAKTRTGIKHSRYGKQHSEEAKHKLSIAVKGKPRAVPHEIVQCPYCKKQGIKPNMKRWHFDNCKNKEAYINESVDKLL
jgi:hypothetical protein